jgi:hypothetical protein
MAEGSWRKPKLPNGAIKAGFINATIDLQLSQIVPLKAISLSTRQSSKYLQIVASIREIGIIEPLVVSPEAESSNRYILLDGHLRLEALKDLQETEATCLISTDNEAFTYNKHISRLTTIQEHKMILQAIKRGVPAEKLAKALNIDVICIVRKCDLLNGICPEVAEILKDKMVAAAVFPVIKRMKAFRQIEAVSLMNDSNIYSHKYARALLAATPKNHLVDPKKPKNIKGLDEEKMARMESEMESLQGEYRLIEENYGKDVLILTLAKGYLGTLVSNAHIARYLTQNHPEIMVQFQKIAEMTSL